MYLLRQQQHPEVLHIRPYR